MGDVGRFETECWGRAPLVRRGDGHDFRDVWSIAAFDEFVSGGLRRPLVRLVEHGRPIAAERYTCRVRLGGSDFRDVIDPDRVAELFGSGATVVAQSIHRTHPTVRRFAERLADEISHPIQANSYLTPAGAVGLAPHSDRHDVFVLQIDGSKSWTIDGVGFVELRAGDTAYIPAGTEHSAASTTEPSLHLTIGVLRVTYRSVIQRLLQDGPSSLDDPLPLRYRNGADELTASDLTVTDLTVTDLTVTGIADAIAGVVDHLRSADPTVVAAREAARRTSRPPRAGALAAATRISAIGPATTLLRCAADWRFTELPGGRVRVSSVDARLSAPDSCRAAFERIDHDRRLTVRDLEGLDGDSQVILARRLVAAGLCRCGDD